MPTLSNTNYPRLNDEDEFEELIRDICAMEWGNPDTKRNGRKGQKQHGVDVYGLPAGNAGGDYRGAQCKHRSTGKQLSKDEIHNEIKEARGFPHNLDALIIVTDAPRDAMTQKTVDSFSEAEISSGGFSVSIWFWEDIIARISLYPQIIFKFYRDQLSALSNFPLPHAYPTSPLQVLVDTTENNSALVEALHFRGIRTISNVPSRNTWLDGILVSTRDDDDVNLLKFGAKLRSLIENNLDNYPIFCLVTTIITKKLVGLAGKLDFDIGEIKILNSETSDLTNSRHILKDVFEFGYNVRGRIKTIDVVVRTQSNSPEYCLLDMDWRSRLDTQKFPSLSEWQQLYVPAIKDVKQLLLSLGDKTEIHFNSLLPIPAAIAIGYYFNIREARVGVWGRRTGTSELNEQFWHSNAPYQGEDKFDERWLKPLKEDGKSVILEMTTNFSISSAIQAYVHEEKLTFDGWIQLPLEIDEKIPSNINERHAIGFSNKVGQTIRRLNSKGVSDIHLFCRIPSALGILIGQRFLATGKIHLYWYENLNYRYAYTINE
ncbi:SAVED domain-containing protein [bacterium]|nr:SAVED domain-containing protein [bacterium]